MKRLLMVALLLLFPALSLAATAPLGQTGQTTSYAAGDDGDLEKGVAWPDPRFTDNSDGTVTDNLTGLIWLKDANCLETVGGVSKSTGSLNWANALSWSNALADGACGLSDLSVAGDWRLPNRRELRSLIDYSRIGPALPVGHPFTGVQSSFYWSSSTYADFTFEAWVVNMNYGNVYHDDKASYYYVWPVRGGQMNLTFDLSLAKAGSGTGRVTSSPAGIDCGGGCSASFDENTDVTLTATPDAGSVFSGWGGACSGTGDCVVTMDATQSVTAIFNEEPNEEVTGDLPYPLRHLQYLRTQIMPPPSLNAPGADIGGYFRVSWGAAPMYRPTYVLEEATNADFTRNVRTVYTGTNTSAWVRGRLPGRYYYRIKSVNIAGLESGWVSDSQPVWVREPLGGSAIDGQGPTEVPAPPVMTVAMNGQNVSLTWTSVAGATGYTLFAVPYPLGANPTIFSSDMGTDNGFNITLPPGSAYYVAVKAQNANGLSDYSNVGLVQIGE